VGAEGVAAVHAHRLHKQLRAHGALQLGLRQLPRENRHQHIPLLWILNRSLKSSDPDQCPDLMLKPVLRIRDVYPGSRIQIFSIPDPNFFHPGSEFFPSLIRIKEVF
jgi:hypothetical protein